MGKTAMSGPVYGGKCLLTHFGPVTGTQNTSTAAAFVNANRVVPSGEDWFVTEVGLSVSTCSSSAQSFLLKSEGGSTSGVPRITGAFASTVAQTITSWTNPTAASTTIPWTLNVVTASAGEYEGLYVPMGSTMRLVSSGASAPAGLTVEVYGFRRWVPASNRAV